MFAKLVSLLCLASIATGLPQYISPTLGYGVAHAPLGYASSGAIALSGPALSPITGIPTYGSIGGYGISSLAVPKIVAQAPIIQKTIISPPIIKHISPIDPNPQYSYNYGVNDPHTGDNKQAEETLVNGVVHGSYSLTEPDGTIRKVSYTADKINGFNAVVQRLGVAHHTAALHKVITPAVHAPTLIAPTYATGYPAYH